uniref:Uncharacterized protein n=1 Tax=Heterorhabditis bacteriophora TaxID=37862 RepID=A0A1I7XER6_HETBA
MGCWAAALRAIRHRSELGAKTAECAPQPAPHRSLRKRPPAISTTTGPHPRTVDDEGGAAEISPII